MNKRVFIYAYTKLNLGDDLFVKILCERYPNDKFYIMCKHNASVAFKRIKNLTVIPYIPYIDGFFRRIHINISINNILQRSFSSYCDVIVNIGGSIFMQNEKWKYTVEEYGKKILHGKPFYIIGSNFGPYKSEEYYEKYKTLFKKVKDICFRDKYSYDLFSELPNVRYAPDIVFSYLPKYNSEMSTKKRIVISVINLAGREKLKAYKVAYQQKIITLSKYFSTKGYSVILMGFCDKEGDNTAIEEILNLLISDEKQSIQSYYYNGNLEEALRLLQESQYIIATRFHSMILGWILDKPVYPLIYSEKSLNVIKDIGFDGKYTKIQDIEEISEEEVFKSLISSKGLDIDKQVELANLQFNKLDEILL